MKNTIAFTLLLIAASALAQPGPTYQEAQQKKSGPEFEWDKTEHDFGAIPQGDPVTAEYKFKNMGSTPIILSNVKSTCGCTVPVWPKEPIMPGEEATIKATYNAKNPGTFTKRITVVSNAKDNYIYLLLKGKVIAGEGKGDQL